MTEPRNPGTDTRDIDHIESEKHGEPQAEILDATGELGDFGCARRARPIKVSQGAHRSARRYGRGHVLQVKQAEL